MFSKLLGFIIVILQLIAPPAWLISIAPTTGWAVVGGIVGAISSITFFSIIAKLLKKI